jgi:nucleoside recognition membrane protein YjiH
MLAASFLDSVYVHGFRNPKMRDVVAMICVNKSMWIDAVIGCVMVLRIRHSLVLTMRYGKILTKKCYSG